MAELPLLRRLTTAVLGVVTVASLSLLAVLSFLGLYTRPTADDWCVLWKTRDMGVLGITKDFYLTQNGRVANAFVSGLVNVDGTAGMRVFPAFLVASFGLGLALLLAQIWRMLGWQAPALVFAALTVVIEMVLFAGAHNPYQALLWAPGSISHTLPTIIAVWAVYLGLRAGASDRRWIRAVSVTGALGAGFFLGTLTEPALVVLGLLAGGSVLCCIPRLGLVRTWHPALWCAAVGAGLVAGYAVLYTSPGAQLRREQSPTPPSLLSEKSLSAAGEQWLRVMDILTSQWTHLGVVAVGLVAGALTVGSDAPPLRRRTRVLVIAAGVAVTPLLLAASYLVILGVRQGYPVFGWMQSRIWFNFVAPMTLTLCAYGVIAGRLLHRILAGRHRAVNVGGIAMTIVLAGGSVLLCAAALLTDVRAQADFAVPRAEAFDAQDNRVRAEAAKGAKEVVYHTLRVPGLADPLAGRPGTRLWVDDCAARYYQIDSLVAPPQAAK